MLQAKKRSPRFRTLVPKICKQKHKGRARPHIVPVSVAAPCFLPGRPLKLLDTEVRPTALHVHSRSTALGAVSPSPRAHLSARDHKDPPLPPTPPPNLRRSVFLVPGEQLRETTPTMFFVRVRAVGNYSERQGTESRPRHPQGHLCC